VLGYLLKLFRPGVINSICYTMDIKQKIWSNGFRMPERVKNSAKVTPNYSSKKSANFTYC
jgi:hypothetical protein